MTPDPHKRAGAAFAFRLALFYSALCAALGVQMPFLPVWFAAKGLDASWVGVALAIPMLVRLFAIPAATHLADRHDAVREVVIGGTVAASIGYAVLGLAPSPAALLAAVALSSFFYAPLMPLADTYALRGLGLYERSYGPVRLWGSGAFIIGSLGGGGLLEWMAAENLIWIVVGALVLTTGAACSLAPLEDKARAAVQASAATALLRDHRFLLVLAAAALIQASHAVYYGFSALQWQAAGLDGTSIGALWALGVAAEIALFALSGRFPMKSEPLLLAGAAGAAVRWGAMALSPPPGFLVILQCLHALSFGATHLGAVSFVARVAPVGQGASAQGYLGLAQAVVMAGAMGISGELYARWDSRAYAAMALLAVIGGLLVLWGSALPARSHGPEASP
jgi:PPP family 3-phenylpropionic acid transporter